MKENMERWIHFNMALIGGFIGGYAILNHCDLFGSAQTANMISIAMDAAGKADSNWLVRIIGLLVYVAGLMSTVFIPYKIKKINMKLFSLIVDAIALTVVGFFPAGMNHFLALYPLFLATAIQWCSFKGADGFVSSSIFSTNNLRQCTTSFAEYFCTKDQEALRKGKFFGKVLISYHIGVMASFLSCQAFGLKGSWIALIPVCTAMFLVLEESGSKVKVLSVGTAQVWIKNGVKELHMK